MKTVAQIIKQVFVEPRQRRWMLSYAQNVHKLPGQHSPADFMMLKVIEQAHKIETDIVDQILEELRNDPETPTCNEDLRYRGIDLRP